MIVTDAKLLARPSLSRTEYCSVAVPPKLNGGEYRIVPSDCTTADPTSGPLAMDTEVRLSVPSGSLSFRNTSMTTGVLALVLTESGTADGDELIVTVTRASFEIAPSASRTRYVKVSTPLKPGFGRYSIRPVGCAIAVPLEAN